MTKLVEAWIAGKARVATFRDNKLLFIDGVDYWECPTDWMFLAMHAHVKQLYK